jgi:hypothetical protein
VDAGFPGARSELCRCHQAASVPRVCWHSVLKVRRYLLLRSLVARYLPLQFMNVSGQRNPYNPHCIGLLIVVQLMRGMLNHNCSSSARMARTHTHDNTHAPIQRRVIATTPHRPFRDGLWDMPPCTASVKALFKLGRKHCPIMAEQFTEEKEQVCWSVFG